MRRNPRRRRWPKAVSPSPRREKGSGEEVAPALKHPYLALTSKKGTNPAEISKYQDLFREGPMRQLTHSLI